MFFNQCREPLRVAVVSAHPDDETLGAGGTLARHTALGDEVHVCVVTCSATQEGVERAREQARRALGCLGIDDIAFLSFPTVKLNAVPGKELNDRVTDFIRGVDPGIVYAPSPGDLNSDHGIVARAAAVATRPLPGRRISFARFETLSSTEWGRIFMHGSFNPSVYVDISETLEKKIKAAGCYKSELKEFPHPRSLEGIVSLAKIRGMEAGVQAAEAFELAIHVT